MGQGFITNWGSFVLLQIGASVITNWGSLVITKWGRRYYELGQLLQIRATVITNWGKLYYKLGQLLQIGAIITNWGITTAHVVYLICIFGIFWQEIRPYLHVFYIEHTSMNQWNPTQCIVVWYLGHFLTQEMNLSRNVHQKSSRNCQHSHSGVINKIFISRNILEYGLEMCCFIAAF